MATLIELRDSGDLVSIDPGLEKGELPWRCLYATQTFIEWLDSDLPNLAHNQMYGELSPLEQVAALFAEYVEGEEFDDDRRFKKLNRTPSLYIWELKTVDVRIFGWVPKINSFVCCFGDSKDEIMTYKKYDLYMAQTYYVMKNLNLDEPKCITGTEYSDVISNKD